MSEVPEVAGLHDTTFNGDFMMAVPLVIFRSGKWQGRGKALFDAKTDALDALDEVISQWLDAVRMGRVKRYIPEDMVPRDPATGQLMEANPFDNDFIAVGSLKTEGAQDKIDVSQPQISYEAYVNSYASFMDLVLQGIISPATLGIDLKKTDNAEAQREKEKVTMHVRGKIVDTLNDALPLLVERIMKTNYLIPALWRAKKEGLSIPIVYNTGSYERVEAVRALEGLVDVWMPDLKYVSPALSARHTGAADYFRYASAAIAEMVRQCPEPVFSDGGHTLDCPDDADDPLLIRGVLVRHLALPGCGDDSRAVLRYLHETYGNRIFISIMNQYTPMPQILFRRQSRPAEAPDRSASPDETARSRAAALFRPV